MKTALLITNEKTKDELFYNRIEFIKALEKQEYTVRTFDVAHADEDDRDMLTSTDFDFAIVISRIFNFSNSGSAENYRTNLNLLIDLYNSGDVLFVNDLISHIDTCNKWLSISKLMQQEISIAKTALVILTDAEKNSDGSVDYTTVDINSLNSYIEQVGGYPFVYKRLYGAEGKHVHLVQNDTSFKALLDSEQSGPIGFILQEYVSTAEAVMFCVRVVGEQVFTRMFIGSPYGTRPFKSITATGRQQLPCHTTDEIRTIALSAVNTLGLDTARIDMFLTPDGIKICEVNSIGSLLPTDQTHNIRVAELIVNLAEEKLKQKNLEADNAPSN